MQVTCKQSYQKGNLCDNVFWLYVWQVVEFSTATEADIEAVLQKQQERDRGGRPGASTERLPGDIIYEMLPGKDKVLCECAELPCRDGPSVCGHAQLQPPSAADGVGIAAEALLQQH